MKKNVWLMLMALFNVLIPQYSNAEVKLPAIVSSNMVLQRNTTIDLWGWADLNEKIVINASWLDMTLETRANDKGEWRIKVETTNSKIPQNIKIQGKTSHILLDNVLLGEVWLCSGQSNMAQSFKGYPGQPTYGATLALANSKNTNLRLFQLDRVGSNEPLKDIEKHTSWQQASPESVLNFSAVAYFFGKQLQEILDVPVGIIHASWGGSKVQAWISQDAISKYQRTNLEGVDITNNTRNIPAALFNGMINPLIPYTIKGALWYQGESDRMDPEKYKKLFPAMVKDWRSRWGIGDFPFYYVQISPYRYNDNNAFQGVDNSAFLREAQLQCLDLIPNSGIAITMDIGDEKFIHPPKKKEVADRLLFNALHQTYGFETIDSAAPIFNTQSVKDGGIVLEFRNAETGLYTYDDLEGFLIAGKNKVFYPATARIVQGKDVFVSSDEVPDPVAVRYAWKNWIVGTLYDNNLLPASSFRTDTWNEATQAGK
ncbi:sialate O-acetylesterase [Arenibacter algicola]|uniref:Carbohydrate esterase, sialic acid-specific acetylesterase n=1 Tax=Arenibacter algicola TaxID=616991 RepID=A0A221UTG8_9FLAO|nr:sialate O-acetylesterase [Arenibacter algicola]ASO04612.1 carbohydrate esterase, sialic acid-specific acetylesterase [Arenibacter algicola]